MEVGPVDSPVDRNGDVIKSRQIYRPSPVVTLQNVLHHRVGLAEQVRGVGVLLYLVLQSWAGKQCNVVYSDVSN